MAVIGHRIEAWQAMKDGTIPLEDRRKRLGDALEKEYVAAVGKTPSAITPEEENQLMEDLEHLATIGGSEEEISAACDQAIEYYKEVRALLLKEAGR